MAGAVRRAFNFPHYDMATWFPGHMFKGLQKMQKKIGEMDCVIEVHDARIALTGRNPIFNRHAKMRPHILVLNKTDLIDQKSLRWLKSNSENLNAQHVIFTDMKNKTRYAAEKILTKTMAVVELAERYHHRSKDDAFNLLIVGIPNVGKSSLINFLRNTSLGKKGRSTKVGAQPGVTRSVLEKIRVCDEPKMFLFDTPGIVSPKVDSAEVALKLAACNTVKSHVIGEEMICDFILYHLNRRNLTRYVELYGLKAPSDDVLFVLQSLAAKENKVKQHVIDGKMQTFHDLDFATARMLKDFSSGALGLVNFDYGEF